MMGIIYIVGAVQALFFSVLIGFKKNRNKADSFLTVFFLIMMLSFLFAYSNLFEFYKSFPLIMPVIVLVPLLYGPVLYFYVYELKSVENKKRRYRYHLIPIFLFFLFMSPLFLNKAAMLKSFTDSFIDLPLYVNLGGSILYLSAPTYFVFILIMLRKHKKDIKDSFSYNENINLNWMNYLVIGAILLWIPEIGRIIYINYFSDSFLINYTHIVKSSHVVFIFLVGFYGLRQGNIFTEAEYQVKNSGDEKSSECMKVETLQSKKKKLQIDNNCEIYKKKLLDYIRDEKPFLNSNLKLLDIAVNLDIPPHILSNVINEKLNKNFFNLINSYRVENAKEILSDPKSINYTILSVAFDCGFNSKSSFNRIFKDQTGLTPSVYQKKNLLKK